MNRLVIGLFAGVIALGGCSKNGAARPGSHAEASSPRPADQLQKVAESDPAAVLAELTHALRKFSVENRRVPASLDELLRAGYLRAIPTPPPGKKFAIDPKRVEVVLASE
ncbi:MAG: hypothetical protein NZ739_03675 [Verrucomicrobiae bacterium]|nr:hypothetical protein [Verrucomicrobiae bacterium]MCX7721542.1 hypothetical protein [Verrucomicrobiae bacterium]MDW7980539.1 hypothetical protein [Verrucomicrobiales bacterium]